ncbi:chromate transporter, partial [Streptomyces alkaliphilus]|uniref:chromate transporter n=1 Tax=Streptomyces alkaliphilus TaxID=1472722 RepID=UPI0027BA8F51
PPEVPAGDPPTAVPADAGAGTGTGDPTAPGAPAPPGLGTIAREWGRIGLLGFGGPPAHIAMLRETCVERRRWIDAERFEDGIASTNLLPGPASTQLAILTAWWLRGTRGALVGGLCFIVPGLLLIIALAALFLSGDAPAPIRGAAAGAGAAVAAVAAHAAWQLMPDSRRRAVGRAARARWYGYLAA